MARSWSPIIIIFFLSDFDFSSMDSNLQRLIPAFQRFPHGLSARGDSPRQVYREFTPAAVI
jgi:hypothetical protein